VRGPSAKPLLTDQLVSDAREGPRRSLMVKALGGLQVKLDVKQ
jgi:hypothetical protein